MKSNKNRIIFSLLWILVFAGCDLKQQNNRKPNIIYILADDLGYGDLGCYGQKIIQTPEIDKMAAEGIKFTQHYAGSTVCAPSRSTIMTGMHTGHTRVRGNANVPLLPEDVTVAELLKSAGYSTAVIGKWGLGSPESSGIPNEQGFDYFYGYLSQLRAHNSYPDYLWENTEKVPLDNEIELIQHTYAAGIGSISTNKKTHSHDLFTQKALDFIHSKKDSSFFLYLAYTIPHANNEANTMGQIGMEAPDTTLYASKSWPAAQKAHAAMITYMDRDIGRILSALHDDEIAENTVVFFTSDNGPHMEGGADPAFFDSNGPLRGMKRDLYEGGIRVPLIAWWPETISANGNTDHISAFWDFLPTACDIAGTQIPGNIDGISMLPILTGLPQPEHDYLYWEFFEQGGRQAIRKGDMKGIRLGMSEDPNVPIMIFNLSWDLGEENDISADNPDLVKEFTELFEQARTPSDDFKFKFEIEKTQ